MLFYLQLIRRQQNKLLISFVPVSRSVRHSMLHFFVWSLFHVLKTCIKINTQSRCFKDCEWYFIRLAIINTRLHTIILIDFFQIWKIQKWSIFCSMLALAAHGFLITTSIMLKEWSNSFLMKICTMLQSSLRSQLSSLSMHHHNKNLMWQFFK